MIQQGAAGPYVHTIQFQTDTNYEGFRFVDFFYKQSDTKYVELRTSYTPKIGFID